MPDSSLNVIYNSTLEGSVAVVLCDGFEIEAFCHRSGNWNPQLNDSVCNVAPTQTIAGELRGIHYNILATTVKILLNVNLF